MQTKKYHHLSIHVEKKQLDQLIRNVLADDFRIFWGFNSGKMILNIYNTTSNNQLSFLRHKGYLELTYAELNCQDILSHLNHQISFLYKVEQEHEENQKQQHNEVYERIDFYLSELHDCMNKDDQKRVTEIKEKLLILHEQLEKVT
ncbi:hypothetical protein [Alkalihalobacterium bogoriense]|uniref:hypothetical protein n=1 Tax=Alkalihalobacterium bogoriense TaxID=246272 RepID=UPI00047E7C6A|nr:hypothetical protein [Alkalihalobacterium bogoriense]